MAHPVLPPPKNDKVSLRQSFFELLAYRAVQNIMGLLGILEDKGKTENPYFGVIGREKRPRGQDHVRRPELGAFYELVRLPVEIRRINLECIAVVRRCRNFFRPCLQVHLVMLELAPAHPLRN